jgi:hypothetical protein
MNLDRKRFWLAVRLILPGAMLLFAAAVALPSLMKSRWASCGMPVLYKVSVADAFQTNSFALKIRLARK